MKPIDKPGGGTRVQLLEAACKVFAEKGYRDATIAEICEQASANIAAVNYHFRDKETLYAEAWRLAFQRSLEAYPPDGGIPAGAPAEERLRGRIFSLVQRIINPENHEFEIVRKELANPTGLLEEVMRESIEPLARSLSAIVRELIGGKASALQVRLCQMSIMAQCLHPMMRRRFHKLFPARPSEELPLSFGVQVIAEHIIQFSLAGIKEIRQRIEGDEYGRQA
jgi:TetR/AcrR family transcriptional regulator, regulator of cefoperazone and chloramphenicol sensitivity